MATGELTYEAIVDALVRQLVAQGALVTESSECDWEAFKSLSDRVHCTFEVGTTTFTPMMRRLMFALGRALKPRRIVGLGTHTGYPLAWLVGQACHQSPLAILAVDIDETACSKASRNLHHLGHGDRLEVRAADGHDVFGSGSPDIDLLYIDVDGADGKAAYRTLLERALPCLAPGGHVLAHDPCVPRFAEDFAAFHTYVESCQRLSRPYILPVDACGLEVIAVDPKEAP